MAGHDVVQDRIGTQRTCRLHVQAASPGEAVLPLPTPPSLRAVADPPASMG
jgi:hypothetical protein